MRFARLLVIFSAIVLSACASAGKTTNNDQIEKKPPALLEAMPTEIETFSYGGYRYFEDESTGYTFRYANEGKQRMADVYVYPVAQENQTLDHDELVLGSTKATLQAISDAVQQGLYSNFNVLGAATQARGLRTVARVEATYLRQNLASYTLVYQTEYDGTLMKIRVSMPDNESNRQNLEWDRFAKTVFDKIVSRLDEKRKNDLPLNAESSSEVKTLSLPFIAEKRDQN